MRRGAAACVGRQRQPAQHLGGAAEPRAPDDRASHRGGPPRPTAPRRAHRTTGGWLARAPGALRRSNPSPSVGVRGALTALPPHQVKALAWCPFHHNILASGGGTADRKICLWNTSNGTCLNEAPPPPPSRTDWTRLVPSHVLTGRVSSLPPYLQRPRPLREQRSGAPGMARCATRPGSGAIGREGGSECTVGTRVGATVGREGEGGGGLQGSASREHGEGVEGGVGRGTDQVHFLG